MNKEQNLKNYKERRAKNNKKWYAKHGAEYQARQRIKWKSRTEEQKAARTLKQKENYTKKYVDRPRQIRLRFRVLARDNFICRYCGRGPDNGVTLQIDHIVPKSKGGGNNLDNLITACQDCNLGKADALLDIRINK